MRSPASATTALPRPTTGSGSRWRTRPEQSSCCSNSVSQTFSPMFNIEIDAILSQADEYARSREVLDREVLREMLMHLIAKAAGD